MAQVASAGASATDSDSPAVYVGASMAFVGLTLIALALLWWRGHLGVQQLRRLAGGRLPRPNETQADLVAQPHAAPSRASSFDLDAEQPRSPSSRPATSAAVSLASSQAGVRLPQAGAEASSHSWAARSIVYRYLRRGPRSGNDIEARSRLGWRMRAMEPPNMNDPASAAASRATSGATMGAEPVVL